jgi:Putative DNA-binding domain
MSIWTKPIDAISWQDVLDFCAVGHTEGVRVDYKAQMPPKGVAKHVAAFANTLGGVLLIGVDADRTTGKPRLPVRGMALPPGITEQIDMQCVDGIYPPVLPETRIVEDPATLGTGFVVVRVHESVQAPHAIQNSTQVYIRKDDHSRPEELASLSWVEHLLARRAKPEALRNRLALEATRRVERDAMQGPFLSVVVSPMYPFAPLKPEQFVLNWAEKSNRYEAAWPLRPRAGGISQRAERAAGKLHRYIEFHATGFSFAAAPLPVGQGDDDHLPTRYVDQMMFCYEMLRALRDGEQFLQALGFRGLATVEIALANVGQYGLYHSKYMPPGRGVCQDETVQTAHATTPDRLFAEDTMLTLLNALRWAMGYQVGMRTGDPTIAALMDQIRREYPDT